MRHKYVLLPILIIAEEIAEKLDRGTMKIKICQLKLSSEHMLPAGDYKEYGSSIVH